MDANSDQHNSGERIAKVIARAGLASRREAELWIAAGRVAVNDKVIDSPALNVTERDRIVVDGVPLPAREHTRLFLYHKPRGLMTTHADPRGRSTIFQNLPKDLPRLISIGRLDFNTEGLLLLTNDGALARVLELPATGWLRRYRVRAHGSIEQDKLDALRNGVTIGGIRYGAIDAAIERVQASNLWLTFAIREGKNHEVRNVLAHLGLTVTRLIRVSFGPFQLGEIAVGTVAEVPTGELREQLGEKLAAQSGADFSKPVAPPRPTAKKAASPGKEPDKPKGHKGQRGQSAHVWRKHEEEQPGKKLRRGFRGLRSDKKKREAPAGDPRPALLTDRNGRFVPVERYGEPPVKEPQRTEAPKRGRFGRRHSADRASGPRPRHPRGRR